MDNRGASVDLIKALPGIMKQNNATVTADIIGGLRRGKYTI
jgi:hypothetical protein